MDNINVTNKINNMSEKELKKQEVRGKLVVFLPMVILVAAMLFLSSCSSTSQCQGFTWGAATNCPAYR